MLRRVWLDPESFRPRETVRDITEAAARRFAALADGLRRRSLAASSAQTTANSNATDSASAEAVVNSNAAALGSNEAPASTDQIAHFLTQCVFCFFAEDVGLLPGRMFARLVNNRHLTSDKLALGLKHLFVAMRDGGLYGSDELVWFNGGLFGSIAVPQLSVIEVTELRQAAALNWQAIDVSIFGTLFERGLDPAKRSQLGAHYTDPATIDRIIDPVLRQPLLQKWKLLAQQLQALQAKSTKKNDKYQREAKALFIT